MIDDLLWHELEVVKSFFARAMSWADAESKSEDARLARISNPDSDTIEGIVTHPHGAHNLEQIAIRAVVNELNSLCEFALQNTWVSLSTRYDLPTGEFVFTATRGKVESALLSLKLDVKKWPQWEEVLKIKEMSEGFKHRQRMQPFPIELQSRGFEWRATRVVAPHNTEVLTEYEPTPAQTAQFLIAIEELLTWLRNGHALEHCIPKGCCAMKPRSAGEFGR